MRRLAAQKRPQALASSGFASSTTPACAGRNDLPRQPILISVPRYIAFLELT
jgi:hypothetical protein